MLSFKDFLYFYRILNWKHKISSIRLLGYGFLSYTLAGKFEPIPIAANIAAVLGALLFWFSINDYSDLRSPGEENYMGTLVKEGKITRKKALTLCLLPLALTPLVILTGSKPAILIFFFCLVWNLLYSMGPLRLKSRRYVGIGAAVITAPLMFLQASSVVGNVVLPIIFMSVIIALFHFYLEILHILEDFQTGEKVQKIPQILALKLLRLAPIASFITSLVFALFYPFFLITTVASVVRILSLKNFTPDQAGITRRSLTSTRLSLYEFALYAVLGLTGRG